MLGMRKRIGRIFVLITKGMNYTKITSYYPEVVNRNLLGKVFRHFSCRLQTYRIYFKTNITCI